MKEAICINVYLPPLGGRIRKGMSEVSLGMLRYGKVKLAAYTTDFFHLFIIFFCI